MGSDDDDCLWRTEGHSYLGVKIVRSFGGKSVTATVTKWYEADEDDDEPSLFHLEHADGDEEDLDEDELKAALPDTGRSFIELHGSDVEEDAEASTSICELDENHDGAGLEIIQEESDNNENETAYGLSPSAKGNSPGESARTSGKKRTKSPKKILKKGLNKSPKKRSVEESDESDEEVCSENAQSTSRRPAKRRNKESRRRVVRGKTAKTTAAERAVLSRLNKYYEMVDDEELLFG
jgi:hypothetical protein